MLVRFRNIWSPCINKKINTGAVKDARAAAAAEGHQPAMINSLAEAGTMEEHRETARRQSSTKW